MPKPYYVYIMSNRSHTLYIGVTNDIQRRVLEHKQGVTGGFTSRYRLTWLVYYEEASDARVAIQREKEIKGWLRSRKITLIEAANPEWHDLSAGWYDQSQKA